jgi:hypothetical protein
VSEYESDHEDADVEGDRITITCSCGTVFLLPLTALERPLALTAGDR